MTEQTHIERVAANAAGSRLMKDVNVVTTFTSSTRSRKILEWNCSKP